MYTQYYDLIQNPFENTPDSNFLFLTPQHRETLSSLEYGIDTAKGFILVAGDVGTGKTTVVNALLHHLSDKHLTLSIVNPRAELDDILQRLAATLRTDVDAASAASPIGAIREKLEALADDDRRFVLIIDEAHLLSEKTLEDIRLLSNIEREDQKLIQIVLVGQNEIFSLLDSPDLSSLKQRLVIIRRLSSMTYGEMVSYIQHRLSVAGRNTPLFEKKALRKIFKRSRGVPRLVNHICDNALLIGFALQKKSIPIAVIREVIQDMDGGSSFRKFLPTPDMRALKWGGIALIACFAITYATMSRMSQPSPQAAQTSSPAAYSEARQEPRATPADAPVQAARFYPATEPEPNPEVAAAQPETTTPSATVDNTDPVTDAASGVVTIVKGEELTLPPVGLPRIDMSKSPGDVEKVQPNEWLRKIALDKYGIKNDTIIDLIHLANPDIKDINRIYPGQEITLPEFSKTDLVAEGAPGNWYIHFASFYHYDTARMVLKETLKEQSLAFMLPCRQNDNTVYRIYVGAFDSESEAKEATNTLNFKYIFLDKMEGTDIKIT